jgi:hypothetical protein
MMLPVIDLLTSEHGLNFLAGRPEFYSEDRNARIPPCIQVLFSVGSADDGRIFKSWSQHVGVLDCVVNYYDGPEELA